jgi:hypothetical protein
MCTISLIHFSDYPLLILILPEVEANFAEALKFCSKNLKFWDLWRPKENSQSSFRQKYLAIIGQLDS